MESGHEEAPPRWQLSPNSPSTGTGLPAAPESVRDDSHPSQSDVTSPEGLIPPYWRHSLAANRLSQASLDGLQRHLIALEDHTEDPASDMGAGLWAQSIAIDDYVVVRGSTGIGAYVVWNCRINTLQGNSMTVRMRYSEFVELREKLMRAFPHARSSMPVLPPKSAFFKFSKKFLEARRVGLAYFLNCVLLNPEFAGSPILKETLFSHCG